MSRTVSPDPTLTNQANNQLLRRRRRRIFTSISDLWREEVDTTMSSFQMNGYYLMSGYMNAISFSAIFVWCGFQSGNTTQLAVAIARLWEGHTTAFLVADQQALASLLSFLVGVLLSRLGESIGPRTRGWLWLATICQAFLTMFAAITSWKSNQGYPGISDQRLDIGPAWDDFVSFITLIFMSASMGMQGLVSMRLKTNSGATLPLTTTWVELFGIEGLFKLNCFNTPRDQRLLGVASVMLGALAARGLVFRLGSPGALGVGAGIRVLIAFSWIFVPGVVERTAASDEEKAEEPVATRREVTDNQH
ncbi:hypothetical protein CPB85DRAFT_1219420 [Mucidula mucida]|nr:hypothetical protein CPB85DRAFT_1219420 [Mucidula mucida]